MKPTEKDLSHLVEDYWETPQTEIDMYLYIIKDDFGNVEFIPEPYRSIFKKHKNKTAKQLREIYPELWL